MKISNPFYSFYAIFFALAMLNAPPRQQWRMQAKRDLRRQDTATSHRNTKPPRNITSTPKRKWNLFFRERPKNSSQFLRAAFPRKSKRNQLQHKQNKTHRAGI